MTNIGNLNITSFDEMLRCFLYGFRSRIMISGNLMLIGLIGIYNIPALCILNYGFGGEHYYVNL